VPQATGFPATARPATFVPPTDLAGAVRAELRRAFHPPFEVPIIVACNGTALVLAWFLSPPRLAKLLFTFHGPLGFPMALAGWMLSDVPATNLIGADPGWTLAALPDRVALRRMVYAKNIVLWLLVAPIALPLAVIVGVHVHRPLATIFTLLWIGVVPLGALGLSAWLGIFVPYHPVPLRRRWAHRRPYRRLLRWLTLAVAPYLLVPGLITVISLPTLGLWLATVHGRPRATSHPLSDTSFAWGVSLGAVLALAFWFVGVRISARLVQRRAHKLVPFLTDPDRG
jgi:hypothetical protein